jgi:hypothetical protein
MCKHDVDEEKKFNNIKYVRSKQCQNKTKFLIQLSVEQTNFAMSKQVNGKSPSYIYIFK